MARRWNKYYIAHNDRLTVRAPVSECTIGQYTGWKYTREKEKEPVFRFQSSDDAASNISREHEYYIMSLIIHLRILL